MSSVPRFSPFARRTKGSLQRDVDLFDDLPSFPPNSILHTSFSELLYTLNFDTKHPGGALDPPYPSATRSTNPKPVRFDLDVACDTLSPFLLFFFFLSFWLLRFFLKLLLVSPRHLYPPTFSSREKGRAREEDELSRELTDLLFRFTFTFLQLTPSFIVVLERSLASGRETTQLVILGRLDVWLIRCSVCLSIRFKRGRGGGKQRSSPLSTAFPLTTLTECSTKTVWITLQGEKRPSLSFFSSKIITQFRWLQSVPQRQLAQHPPDRQLGSDA